MDDVLAGRVTAGLGSPWVRRVGDGIGLGNGGNEEDEG